MAYGTAVVNQDPAHLVSALRASILTPARSAYQAALRKCDFLNLSLGIVGDEGSAVLESTHPPGVPASRAPQLEPDANVVFRRTGDDDSIGSLFEICLPELSALVVAAGIQGSCSFTLLPKAGVHKLAHVGRLRIEKAIRASTI